MLIFFDVEKRELNELERDKDKNKNGLGLKEGEIYEEKSNLKQHESQKEGMNRRDSDSKPKKSRYIKSKRLKDDGLDVR